VSSIENDTFLAAPPSRVWQALTDPVQLAAWLMPNDFEPRVGHRFTFRTDPVPAHGFDGVIRCEVLDLRPSELLRISWVSSGLDTTVTWRLAAEGTGTRLFLTHDGFDDADPRQQATLRTLGNGWRGHLVRRLEDLLSAG
jgi:uncharacterized protein YndB with AHSA1/START domain